MINYNPVIPFDGKQDNGKSQFHHVDRHRLPLRIGDVLLSINPLDGHLCGISKLFRDPNNKYLFFVD